MNLQFPQVLSSSRIRYLEPRDADRYITIEQDPEVKQFVGGPTQRDDMSLRSSIEQYEPGVELLAIADVSTDEYIGRCGCINQRDSNDTEIHIVLGQSAQRRGIGRELVPFLCALVREQRREPVACVHPENAASIALMNRLGWDQSGTRPSGDVVFRPAEE